MKIGNALLALALSCAAIPVAHATGLVNGDFNRRSSLLP